MNEKNLSGTAKFLHQIYTIEGGPKVHDDIQQTKGIVKLAALLLLSIGFNILSEKIENAPIKATEILKDSNR